MDVNITPCQDCKDSFFSNPSLVSELDSVIRSRGEEAGDALLRERLGELHATHA